MNKLNTLDWIALILVLVGGLNWGLIGVFNNFNLVETIFGVTVITTLIYILVGLSAVYWLFMLGKVSKK